MIKINTTLFDYDMIHRNMTYAEVWSMLNDLIKIKEDLVLSQDYIANRFSTRGIEQIMLLEQQLWFLNTNMETLLLVLKTHESDAFISLEFYGQSMPISLN